MARQGDNPALTNLLERMANVLENMNQNQNRNTRPAEYQSLTEFKKNDPPQCKGGVDLIWMVHSCGCRCNTLNLLFYINYLYILF